MNTKRIVITGGPSTGKTAIINQLLANGYFCHEEISRQVTLDARKNGIEQMFITKPLLFSELLLKGRLEQFNKIENNTNSIIFYDRGLPDVTAYLHHISASYPENFTSICTSNKYDTVFILKPWEAIYENDNERYESFEQALEIHDNLVKTYTKYGYNLINVPFDTVVNRTNFILNHVT